MTASDVSRLSADPQAFFAPYDAIVLVANSRDAAGVLSAPGLGERPLFVFFNRVYRIIDKPFDRDCMLVSRSSPVGSSLVYRGELDDVMALLKGPRFHGILNMRIEQRELLSKPEEFKGFPVGFLDLVDWISRIYPTGRRMPSTGFALAMWLARHQLPARIFLSGFTGTREADWRVYDGHDWTWEQIVLNLMYKKGKLHEFRHGKFFDLWPVAALQAEFPDIAGNELSTTAVEVLSNRLAGTNRVIDHIYSALRIQLAVRDFVRNLRPMSRKAKRRQELLGELNKPGEKGGAA
ncbi:MAG TPA: 3-deoxy-manno-octulosonate cytidylyltransferase [Mesorhizobium sp.]|jgi:hypothetical protein|nr:3-deoxy-manno-octulosonate cytidylyltransferase [Mesorhizobium sp.]